MNRMSKAIARVSIIVVVFSIIAVGLVGVYTSTLVSSSPSVSSSVSIASLPTGSLFSELNEYYFEFYIIIYIDELAKLGVELQ